MPRGRSSMPSPLTADKTNDACSPPITEMRVGPQPKRARIIGPPVHPNVVNHKIV